MAMHRDASTGTCSDDAANAARLTPEHRQHNAYEALKTALEHAAGKTDIYGPRIQKMLGRAALNWQLSGGADDDAYELVTMAATAAGIASRHAPSDRMAQLLLAVQRTMAMGAHPLSPIPAHIHKRDTAISGE